MLIKAKLSNKRKIFIYRTTKESFKEKNLRNLVKDHTIRRFDLDIKFSNHIYLYA